MSTLSTLYRLILRSQASRGRVVAVIVLTLFPLAIAIAQRAGGSTTNTVLSEVVLAVSIPLTALVMGTASLGDLRDDSTLVYLWLRPGSRWALALGATLATASVTILCGVVGALGAMIPIGADSGDMIAGLVAAVLAALAYGALGTLAGVLSTRSLVWGLIYLLAWETVVVRLFSGAARLSVLAQARSVARSEILTITTDLAPYGAIAAGVTLLLASAAAIALTRARLDRMTVA